MKAIPLWQPWASLVACGAKRVETRHWPAPSWLVGERIAIHATKTNAYVWLCMTEPFNRYLREPEGLPLGAVIATATLDRCTEMTAESIAELKASQPEEHAFGLYEPGRFAWVLRDVEPLPAAVPFRGRQGIFDVPDELLATRRAA